MFLLLVFLLIAVNLVTTEEVNVTDSVLPEPKNAFKFEDQPAQSYGLIRFQDQDDNLDNRFQPFDDTIDTQNTIEEGQKIKFEDHDNRFNQYGNQNTIDEGQIIKFEDTVNRRPNHQKKKRRRKPKRLLNAQGYGYVRPYPGYAGSPAYPGAPVYPGPSFGPGPFYPGQRPYQPSYPGPLYKPRPSATSAALSAVTEALTSIALYDDAQCVPRLLCEAAGGGTVPGAGLLQSVAGLQPLLTLLAAYNGISSSPLFVFGRAVFLGMTSKANPGTCRYAYPQCPNDPEQLVHYLNNHNGGFFRFFAAPQLNQQQGLEQFYSQLSGQNYGLYPQQQSSLQQGYGLQQNYPNQQFYGQQFGQYQNQLQQGNYQNNNLQPGYGLAQHQYHDQNYNQRPNPYGNGFGLYGQRYPHQKNLNQSKIQKRIQNVRNTAFVNNVSPKWSFPEKSSPKKGYNNVRLGKVLKFPQSNVNSVANVDGFIFPGVQSNREYPTESVALDDNGFGPKGVGTAAEGFIFPGIQSNREYPIESLASEDNAFGPKGVDDFEFYSQNDHGIGHVFDDGSNNDDDVRILYIVRGNGDPNNPEIVRLAPGKTL